MIKLSVGSWAFAFGPYAESPVALEPIAARLSEAEFDGIELSGFPPHATLEQYPNAASRAHLLRVLRDYGLDVSGYAADFSTVNPAVEGNKQNYIDLFQRHIEFCVDTASPSIRVDTVGAPGSVADIAYQAALERVADIWMDAAEIADRAKVRMVWEFEPGFLFNKPSEIVTMCDKVSHPNFQVLFDTSHAYMSAVVGARHHGAKETLVGGAPALLKKLEGRVGAIHIIDSDGTLHHNETSMHQVFGEGYIDFHILAPQMLDIAGIEWWCIDLCYLPDAWELLEPSRDFVLDLIDSKAAA